MTCAASVLLSVIQHEQAFRLCKIRKVVLFLTLFWHHFICCNGARCLWTWDNDSGNDDKEAGALQGNKYTNKICSKRLTNRWYLLLYLYLCVFQHNIFSLVILNAFGFTQAQCKASGRIL